MTATDEIRCPLTGSTDVVLVEETPSERLIALWEKQHDLDISRELEGVTAVRRYRSKPTGLEFFLPLSVTGSDWLYAQLDRFDWYYMPRKWEHDVALKDLAGIGAVLEIGCGEGAFVERAGAALDAPVHGLELNTQAAQKAVLKGLDVSTTPLEAYADTHAGEYGAACAFQVLEHVPEPLTFLRDALRVLRPDGKLLLSVPNCAAFIRHADEDLMNMPPHHMTRWTAEVFEHLETLLPVRLERTAFEPLAAYHVDWYARVTTAGKLFRHRRRRALRAKLESESERSRIRGHTLYVCLGKTGRDA